LVRKQIKVNDIARRAVDFVGQVNVVIFSAQDVELITGAPALSRRYLDLVSSQVDRRYLRCLQQYNKVLLQRNHLLRLLQGHQAQPQQLEFWDKELVENGSYIMLQRQHLVRKLDGLARGIHHDLSHQAENLELVYLPSVEIGEEGGTEIETRFQRAMRQGLNREVSQGMTLVGPHRDHLQFRVNGMDMSKYGSRGQQQTVVLALKLAEAEYMSAQVGDVPILLLDDVFSELDRTRRQHLLESIVSFQQVLITAVDLDYFEPSFLSQASQLRVREGSIEAA
jgi:DNA replication and repair protein RecF